MLQLRTGLVSLLSLLPSFVTAQGVGGARSSHGVQAVDGRVWAGGPDYSARFDGDGVEFTPMLGATAPRPYPVRFTVEGVRRGACDVFVRTGDVTPAAVGEKVRYQHGPDLAEVYDVRAEGIEQSFVFATKPAGNGDLVVAGRITTDLPLAAAGDDGVRYELPGLGGVTFGAVTGVDARGATARGSIRVVGDRVEWVLPASFVEHAAYPLVLDPPIGTSFLIGNGAAGIDTDPSVAYDAATGRYLVAWAVSVSASTSEVRAQLVANNGTLAGGQMLLDGQAMAGTRPSVGNVRATGRFLVGWIGKATVTVPPTSTFTVASLKVRSVDAGNGALSNAVDLRYGLFTNPAAVAIGGDSRIGLFGANQNCLVVWRDSLGVSNSVESLLVHTPASGDPSEVGGTAATIATSTNLLANIAVSHHAGSSGRWLVAFGQSLTAMAGPLERIVGQTIDGFGNLCGATVTLVGGSGLVDEPAVATKDGLEFAVAWHDAAAGHVSLRRGTWTGTCGSGSLSLGPVVTPVDTVHASDQPELVFAKDKFVLAWRSHINASLTKVYAKGLDPDTCATCGLEWRMDVGLVSEEVPAIAARWSGGDTGSDEALVVWSNDTIRGQRFEASSDDIVTSMGGGCSLSGFDDFATYNGDAVIGNPNFQLAIANSVSLPLILIVGFGNLSGPCGSCTIVPTLDILLPGNNPYTLPIPCDPLLVGVDIYTQWLLLKPSDCPILPDFSFTNALRFKIGE